MSDAEITEAVHEGEAQLLVKIFVEKAVANGFFDQQGPIVCEKLIKSRFTAGLGLNKKSFKTHSVSYTHLTLPTILLV